MVRAPSISVCIVTGGRRRQLAACLASLATQEDAPPWELLVCINGDASVDDVVRQAVPDALVATVPHTKLGAARNILLRRARGELLLFLDDDVVAEPHLLRRLSDLAERHPEVGVFGGPNATPPGSTRFAVVQGAVLGSIVGSGPVRRRYGAHPAGAADERWFTLCNLAVRRTQMIEFPPELSGGEENAVLVQLSRRRVVMRYEPGLVVYHERRHRLRPFARQMVKYGEGRGQVIGRDWSSTRLAYLLPSLLLAYVALLPVGLLLTPLAAIPAVLYGGAVTASGIKIAWPMRRVRAATLGMGLIVVVHACYGIGVVKGALRRRVAGAETACDWRDATT